MDGGLSAGAVTRRRASVRGVLVPFGVAVAGPALAIGGVHPPVVAAFVVAVAIAWLAVCRRARGRIDVPAFAVLGTIAAAWALVQWLPLAAVREWAAPQMHAIVETALADTGVAAPPGLTPVPADTGLEIARLAALTVLFVVAAQLRWRTVATVVALTGTLVALVGLAHEVFGITRIYGVYAATDVDLASATALRGPFVNANHQSGLLLLGIFASMALAADVSGSRDLGDPARVDAFVAAIAAVFVQLPALVLSLSRGALVVFLLLAPVAAAIAWARPAARAPTRTVGRLAIAAGIAVAFVVVASHGATAELATLAHADEAAATSKLVAIDDALELVALSPVLGIGRGAFVDLYPAVQSIPSHRLATHLECTPAAMIVELGPVVGGLLLAGALAFWWAAWRGGDADDRAPRRIALLGLFALGLQSFADFSLEFLGVAAPAVALAGALAVGPSWRWPTARVGIGVGSVLAVALGLSIASAPDAAMARARVDEVVRSGERSGTDVLAVRPLDGRLHGLLARRAAMDGDWAAAHARALVATRLRPGQIDAWLLLGAASHEAADDDTADDAIARALALVHDVPERALVDWLVALYREPHDLGALAPADHDAWRLLVDALAETSPRHADAFAAARAYARPSDPEPLVVRHAMAMRQANPALALHHARILRAVAPHEAIAHVAVAQALRAFDPPRLVEARDALESALDTDVGARGPIEEELVVVLLATDGAEAKARARVVADALLQRPATRTERVFREGLAAQARAADRRRP